MAKRIIILGIIAILLVLFVVGCKEEETPATVEYKVYGNIEGEEFEVSNSTAILAVLRCVCPHFHVYGKGEYDFSYFKEEYYTTKICFEDAVFYYSSANGGFLFVFEDRTFWGEVMSYKTQFENFLAAFVKETHDKFTYGQPPQPMANTIRGWSL